MMNEHTAGPIRAGRKRKCTVKTCFVPKFILEPLINLIAAIFGTRELPAALALKALKNPGPNFAIEREDLPHSRPSR
jgi:hypothetical protein